MIHPKKKLCVCSTNLGFSVGNATNLGFSVGYVLCSIYVCTWYQPAAITSCEKHSMVVYINEPYPWAQSVVARRQMEVTSWRPGAVDCSAWNEHHSTRLACRRPGPGAHRDSSSSEGTRGGNGRLRRGIEVVCLFLT